MDGSNQKHLSPEGGKLDEESSSFDTVSDNSQEEKVLTVKKRDCDNGESEASENVGDIKNRSRLNDFDGENSSDNSNLVDSSKSSTGNDLKRNSSDTSRADIVDDSKESTGNDSKKTSLNKSKGIGQRLHQGTAASKARQGKKAVVKEIPKPPPIKPATKTVPVPTVMRKKASSTPTKEDCTISDMTLGDVSHIPPALDASMMAPPMLRMAEGRSSVRGNRDGRGGVKKQLLSSRTPLTTPAKGLPSMSKGCRTDLKTNTKTNPPTSVKATQQPLATRQKQDQPILPPSTAVKNLSKPRDVEDGEVTEEALFKEYADYLHAAFINMKTQEALKNAKLKVDRQVFQGFSRNEEMRQKVIAKKKELVVRKALAQLEDSLQVLESRLAPALALTSDLEEKMRKILSSLRSTQHQLAVKGVTIENQEEAKKELDEICHQLEVFSLATSPSRAALDVRAGEVKESAEDFSKLAESFEASSQIVKDCWRLVDEAGELATQEASVAISLVQLSSRNEERNFS